MFVAVFVLTPQYYQLLLHSTLGRAVALLWTCIQTESEYNSTRSYFEIRKTEKNRGWAILLLFLILFNYAHPSFIVLQSLFFVAQDTP
jgi:hypothetical protein